jgi:hypothetical protein
VNRLGSPVALRGVALAGGPMILAQGEQRRLFNGRRRLGAAKRHQRFEMRIKDRLSRRFP